MAQPDNPLLHVSTPIPFDHIRAADVEPAIGKLLEEARERLDALAYPADAPSYGNTLEPRDSLTEPLDRAMAIVRHLESVATYPELRTAYNAVEPLVSAFHTGIPLNAGLWDNIKRYAATGEAASLDGVRRRFLHKTIDDFRRHGADLDAAGKQRLEAIEVELAQITTRFSEHVLDATNAFELMVTDPVRLAGLPPSAVDAARHSAAAKRLDGWRFTLQAPSYVAAMTYMDDGTIRRDLYHAFNTRATADPYDNRGLIPRILELRRQKAELLGYRNFADLVTEDRMAHTGEQALAFIEDLRRKTVHHFERENRELAEFAGVAELAPWEVGYWAEKQRRALYDFDEEELRPYFPMERVLAGLFELAGRLYGIRVLEESGVPTWDPQVRCYSVRDHDGATLGSFYADWFPRENKRGGAWMDSLRTGGPGRDGFETHIGVICGNLTPPLADRPALLTHREVETVFHEFGHLLHHLLSRVEVRSLAGTNVAYDFVELPSQIMENWCWEREALDLFAGHWQTGEPVPAHLFEKMKRARNFRSANAQMRQLGFAWLDLMLHIHYDPSRDPDPITYSRRMLQNFSPARLPDDYAMIAAFTHLFADPVGYGAGYYSYKWSEVLDADAFTKFRESGIFSREVGAAFRANILERGDSEDPAVLYRGFMGRDPNPDALLERSGLLG
ncbi:MAG: M3 family metallopeptidase [Acidobacteria bacterium]|nr:M3 family metallopeptidase [Acidobacteriota bacterium]